MESDRKTDSTDADRAIGALIEAYRAAVSRFVAPGEAYALVDFPDHYNVGDSAIYAGEMVFFDSHVGCPPAYVCSRVDYRRDLEDHCPEGPIFIHGGGNFGDMWPRHQDFRIEILEHYRHRKVIQLAESIHFRQEAERDRIARVIATHGNFTLMVRDRESFDLATRHFECETLLCPDAAHFLWHLPPTAAPEAEVLSLLREDHERRDDGVLDYLRTIGPVDDWHQIGSRPVIDKVFEKLVMPRLPPSPLMMRRRERMYRRETSRRMDYGVALLSKGEVIVSDRLHAHIIASLMRKPHVALDNSYGKISRYIETWGEDGLAIRATGLDAVKDALHRIRQDADARAH